MEQEYLQDLEKSVEQVKKDTQRFKVSERELEERMRFITDTRAHIQSLFKQVTDQAAKGKILQTQRNVS